MCTSLRHGTRPCHLRFAALVLLIVAWGPLTARAQPNPVLTVSGGSGLGVDGDITIGWRFDVLFPTTVAELGLLDDTPDTFLDAPHRVGIWSPAGDLLANTVVAIDAPVTGRFRYQLVDPVVLPPAIGYVIGALYNTNVSADFPVAQAASSTAPSIGYQVALQNGGGGFSRPDIDLAVFDDGIFGPSFTTLDQQVSATKVTGGANLGVQGDITIGWTFDIADATLIAELGIFDPSPLDPLATSHEVGLWSADGTLLAQTIVPPDAPFRGGFRWVAVAPVVLEPGQGYSVGALYNTLVSADFPKILGTVETADQVIFGHAAQSGSGFARPDILQEAWDPGGFGPSFSIAATEEPALSFEGGNPIGVDGDITTGWTFDVIEPILVGELGLADLTADTPLFGDHQVGLWSPSGELLAEATVTTDAPWRAGFRWVALDPIVLEVGSGYTLGALFNTNIAADFPITGSTSTTAPEIVYGHTVQNGGGFSQPTIDQSPFDDGVFGPSLSITRFDNGTVFADGFESGNESAWTVTIP